MNFEMNEYHRDIADEDMLTDIIRVADKLKKSSITTREYTQFGQYSSSTIIRRFGGWNAALQSAGLDSSRVVKRNKNHIGITNREMISDVQKVAALLQKDSITTTEYTQHGRFDYRFLLYRFGTWKNVLEQAELCQTKFHHSISEDELLKEIERIWIILGRQPTSGDIRDGISIYSLNTYARKFGGWRKSLQVFINYINKEKIEDGEKPMACTIQVPQYSQHEIKVQRRKTVRDIDLRLRFKVMHRDNFKCCKCGASPAKDPSVELHVDHIIPWSKGGETVIENLQTLCSKCNLGKSDLILD